MEEHNVGILNWTWVTFLLAFLSDDLDVIVSVILTQLSLFVMTYINKTHLSKRLGLSPIGLQ